MTWNARACATCGVRYEPRRIDEKHCSSCAQARGRLQVVQEYMRRYSDADLTRVTLATGAAEEEIRAWAADGSLPSVPAGAADEGACTCTGGQRCPACRAKIAARIAGSPEVRSMPRTREQELAAKLRGMGTRRSA